MATTPTQQKAPSPPGQLVEMSWDPITRIVGSLGIYTKIDFEQHKVVGAWCELRNDYRHFRIDRIATLAATGERAPRRRHAMLKEWRERMDQAVSARTETAARN